MKKIKSNRLLKISIFSSIVIHVIAIASINHLEIHSYLVSKNISFSNKTQTPTHKKTPSQIVNIVMQKKQKSSLKDIKASQKKAFPTKEKDTLVKNIFDLQKDDSHFNNVNFCLNTMKQKYKLLEKQKDLPSFDMNHKSIIDNAILSNPILDTQIKDIALEKTSFLKIRKEKVLPQMETAKNLKLNFENKIFAKQDISSFKFNDISQDDDKLLNELTKLRQKKIKLFPNNFSLVYLPQLSDLTTISYKDFFDIDVSFAPNHLESGFIFAITLIPKPSFKLKKLKQNIFFLVDRSNSIQKDRLTSTRHAIVSSLSCLEKDDSFNILAFDNKLDVLAPNNLKPNEHRAMSKAKEFLRKQNIGSFFSSTNFSIPLFKILNSNVKDNEINVAILLSNGDGLNKFKNYRILNDWTQLNSGNLSLYTLGLNSDKNLSILELFSFLNKGKVISSNTNRGIKRKLQKLIKSINYPIAKDIVSNVICFDKNCDIKIYPPPDQSPNLYMNQPYVILGTTKKLKDFTIFVQGKGRDNFFNLKKYISFDRAKQGGKILQKELAIKKASICYEEFLADNDSRHLNDANNHLKPFEIEPIFK